MQTVLDLFGENTNIASTCSSPSSRDDSKRTSARDRGQTYKVLSEDKLRDQQEKAKAKVRNLLSIPLGVAEVLLRHNHWTPQLVKWGWYENWEVFRRDIGLPLEADNVFGPKVIMHSMHACKKCLGSAVAGGTMRSAGCCHYYCDGCWRQCILEAVDAGPQCLSLWCLEQSCQVPVTREPIEMVAGSASYKKHYDWYALTSYVDDSGGRIKWCPGGCGIRAIEFFGGIEDSPSPDVVCECKRGFCWICGKEPHQPLSCYMACAWLEETKKSKGSPRETWQLSQYERWEDNHKSMERALVEMKDLRRSWRVEMDFYFLAETYEEIAECRRVMGWLYGYGYFLNREHDTNKWVQFGHLQNEAKLSLELLDSKATRIATTEFEDSLDGCNSAKRKIMDLTKETRHYVNKLVTAVKTDFHD